MAVAAQMWEQEKERKVHEREAALAERVPPLNLSGLSLQELLVYLFIPFSSKNILLLPFPFFSVWVHLLYSHTTRGCLLLFTGPLQRLAPQDWCCGWGAVWYQPQGAQKWHWGELLTNESEDKTLRVEVLLKLLHLYYEDRVKTYRGAEVGKHCIQVEALRITGHNRILQSVALLWGSLWLC